MLLSEKRYRTRQEKIIEILETTRTPKLKIKIMYDAYIPWNVLKDCIVNLKSAGMINQLDNGEYVTTDKGHRYLELIHGLRRELEGYGG